MFYFDLLISSSPPLPHKPTIAVLACRERQASIVSERYFRFEISLFSILCMLIARMEMGTSRVSGDSDIITLTTEHLLDGKGRVVPIMMM